MTENETPNLTDEEREELKDALIECADIVLSDIVDVAERASMSITLTIPGATVRGTVIPASEFSDHEMRRVRENAQFPEGVDPDDALEPFVSAIGIPSWEELSDFQKVLPPRFLHLKDVRMIGNGYTLIAPYEPPVIRIPLAQVTSWHLGWID